MHYEPKPIPDGPTHCRVCGFELEPLRRWGGLCKDCVPRAVGTTMLEQATTKLQWREVKRFTRVRKDGQRNVIVVVRCSCGTEREMTPAEFEGRSRRANACKRCRKKFVRTHGVEGFQSGRHYGRAVHEAENDNDGHR